MDPIGFCKGLARFYSGFNCLDRFSRGSEFRFEGSEQLD